MARDLYSRLKRLREYQSIGQPPVKTGITTPGSTSAGSGALADWSAGAPFVFTRRSEVAVPGPAGEGFESRLLSRPVAFCDLCFMDTETTGLSGGAGTTVFLVGSAHYQDGVVSVEQTLLSDFPGETNFLQIVQQQLWSSGIWVSYNGKAFDSRLIQTRFVLNGQDVIIPDQLDLLYWSRRLWQRRIGRCSLGDIEREILGVVRTNDVAGIEIPDRYFAFLKTGDAGGLLPVFFHHLEDIVSLVRLFFHIEGALELVARSELDPGLSLIDRIALGKYLVLHGAAGGEALLRGVVTSPQPDESMDERERAASALARQFRRNGRIDDAAKLWEHLWADGSGFAGIEFAKYLEHRVNELDEAVAIVEVILSRSGDAQLQSQLNHRLLRLRRKLER